VSGNTLTVPALHASTAITPTARGYSVRRYYDPKTGQFINVDPAVDQTHAPYAYVNGDPIDGIDPLGLGCFLDIACGVQSWGQHVVGQIAYNVVGTLEQLPTTFCEIGHAPGAFLGSVAGYSLGAGFFALGGYVGAELLGSEAPGLLAELSHPADAGIGGGSVALASLVPFYLGYLGSEDLSRQ
jgi:hypothetical protein